MRTFETSARFAKSSAILILLLRAKFTAELVQMMTAADWHKLAEAARVNRPSPETRESVLSMLRQVETPLAGTR
jgi:hypothetical protein